MLIKSDFRYVGKVPNFTDSKVKNEPMLFNCDLEHAHTFDGPITKAFLNEVIGHWGSGDFVVDTRVHMLMPGWYPCIPGYHHDDVPRTRSDGQPNYALDQDRSEHIVCLVNGDICPTDFAVGESDFEEPALGRIIYRDWHKEVERKIEQGILQRVPVLSNMLAEFDDRSWHQGTKAIGTGWRWFGRISRYRNRYGEFIPRGNPRSNEIRRQVQVYMDNPHQGW
jgi:hypothetical protein